jgi:hypothetical protein
MTLLNDSNRTFRVEKVPLCYMTDFAWASTETRKIVKMEERIVHFLDDKQTVRQTDWDHLYAETCKVCSLRSICGGLFDRGGGYSPDELHPVFVPLSPIVSKVIFDPGDPSNQFDSMAEWRSAFNEFNAVTSREQSSQRASSGTAGPPRQKGAPAVGQVTKKSQRLYESKRRKESKRAVKSGIQMEKAD